MSKQIYVGKTNDLRRRLNEHNHGQQTSTKRKSGEWILVYVETYRSKRSADQRELRLKQHGRAKQELFKRLGDSLIT
ncbi:MAG: GIY-YIG nuclease family protein [Candidatus Colwellbacteria bacterium]|nr:GIY-YIG nuclease family protein [Candidatus Colwellbacteria bacterium]